MEKRFEIVSKLIIEAYEKAFNAKISQLSSGEKRSQFNYKIEEVTGLAISERTLANLVTQVIDGEFGKGGPRSGTLEVLSRYVLDIKADDFERKKGKPRDSKAWFRYQEEYAKSSNPSLSSFIVKNESEKQILLLKKNSFLFVTGFLVLLSIVFLYYKIPEFSYKKKQIIVGRIIHNEDFLLWLKESFESVYTDYEIIYKPSLGSGRENSTDRFYKFIHDKNFNSDIYLGGNSQLHQKYTDHFGSLTDMIPRLRDSISYIPKNLKSLGYYQKLPGFIWNKSKVPFDWIPKSLENVQQLSDSLLIIPRINSSTGRDFFLYLSNTGSDFDYEIGLQRYKRYRLNSVQGLPNVPINTMQYLAKNKKLTPAIAFAQTHDQILNRKYWGFNECIGIAIPDDAVLTVSCISVKKGNEYKQGVRDFIMYALSYQAQRKLFEITNKFPANKYAFKDAISVQDPDKKIDYIPQPHVLKKIFETSPPNMSKVDEYIFFVENSKIGGKRLNPSKEQIDSLSQKLCL